MPQTTNEANRADVREGRSRRDHGGHRSVRLGDARRDTKRRSCERGSGERDRRERNREMRYRDRPDIGREKSRRDAHPHHRHRQRDHPSRSRSRSRSRGRSRREEYVSRRRDHSGDRDHRRRRRHHHRHRRRHERDHRRHHQSSKTRESSHNKANTVSMENTTKEQSAQVPSSTSQQQHQRHQKLKTEVPDPMFEEPLAPPLPVVTKSNGSSELSPPPDVPGTLMQIGTAMGEAPTEALEPAEPHPPTEAEAPNFSLSGALAEDTCTGNTRNGVVLKYNEPEDAQMPQHKWLFFVYKNGAEIDKLHLHRQSAFLLGRDRSVAHIPLDHMSCSSQHAVLQYRVRINSGVRRVCPYLLDLESTNGTFLNGKRLDAARFYELQPSDLIRFGGSTREYVIMSAGSL